MRIIVANHVLLIVKNVRMDLLVLAVEMEQLAMLISVILNVLTLLIKLVVVVNLVGLNA